MTYNNVPHKRHVNNVVGQMDTYNETNDTYKDAHDHQQRARPPTTRTTTKDTYNDMHDDQQHVQRHTQRLTTRTTMRTTSNDNYPLHLRL
ncbi:hypothetical protein BYT27DRAFT_7250332 [Phlegmacium glaucopus]|nr:hypothetical protein BYT27DRAFT_7259263 [Phlegmacium glaucopus]KAF8814130.1 hypothetical protein BYT27DRAFT_7250332 [Phlegmacium glaucopus]